jgi:hypothetical protein
MEKELLQAFEETSNKNIQMILDHSNESRELVRDMETKVLQLEEQVRIQNKSIEDLRLLLVNVQMKVYSGGT